jgi:hypothetical protein
MPKVSLNVGIGAKGPATDASMITEMKRRRLQVIDIRSNIAANPGVPKFYPGDFYLTRGFTNGAVEYYGMRGAFKNFIMTS